MSAYVANPPQWLTTHLAASYVTLEETVPPKWLPKLERTRPAKGGKLLAEIPEYGCGAYGCVIPTLDPTVVLKVTTDETEAEFAAKYAKNLPVPVVTIYHLVAELPSAKRQGRKVFLLWREAADDVGKIDKVVGPQAEDAINEQHQRAQVAYALMSDGAEAKAAVKEWRDKMVAMGKVPELRWLAEGMTRAFDEQGIFWGDIHGGNLGRARGEWVITDPGNIALVKHTTPNPPSGDPDATPAFVIDQAARAVMARSRNMKHKAFISDVYDEVVREHRDDGMTLTEFKLELVRLSRKGAVKLSRCDLVAAFDPRVVAASEVHAGGAEYHYVTI